MQLMRSPIRCATPAAGVLLLLLLAAAILPAPTIPDEHALAARIDRAQRALLAGDAGQVLDDLALIEPQDPALRAQVAFQRGAARQQAARNEHGRRRTELLEGAIASYLEFLRLEPGSAAAANNLAHAYLDLGRSADAERWFRAAITNGRVHRGLYLLEYARCLDQLGRTDDASARYLELVAADPAAVSLHRELAARFERLGGDALARYLWATVEAGWVDRTLDSALDALARSPDDTQRWRRELLSIVCLGLSRQHYDPATFAASEVGQRLRALARDAGVGAYARSIIAVHRSAHLSPSGGHWRPGATATAAPPYGLWPNDAYRAMLRSIASWHAQQGDTERAEHYLRLAIELDRDEIDPLAVEDLVRLQIRTGNAAAVKTILDRYGERLYEGKGLAYRASRWQDILDFHRTFGETYAFLGQWGDAGTVDSAIFQLEHARAAGLELDRLEPAPAADRFTPAMADLLATGYAATGDPARAAEVRIEEAVRYQRDGDLEATGRVLRGLDRQTIPAELRGTYQQLSAQLPALSSPVTLGEAPAAPAPLVSDTSGDAPPVALHQLDAEQRAIAIRRLQQTLSQGGSVSDVDWSGLPGSLTDVTLTGESAAMEIVVDGATVRLPIRVEIDSTTPNQSVRVAARP